MLLVVGVGQRAVVVIQAVCIRTLRIIVYALTVASLRRVVGRTCAPIIGVIRVVGAALVP
jgi:hypothetical protein